MQKQTKKELERNCGQYLTRQDTETHNSGK